MNAYEWAVTLLCTHMVITSFTMYEILNQSQNE